MNRDVSRGLNARHGHGGCMVCGDYSPGFPNLSFALREDGSVHADFLAGAHLQGYTGLLHGGVIATLLDSAMTHCLFHRGVTAVTADLRVRYVQPIACGSRLEIDAHIIKACRSLYQLRGEIACNGTLGAWAEAKFLPKRS